MYKIPAVLTERVNNQKLLTPKMDEVLDQPMKPFCYCFHLPIEKERHVQ